MKPRSYTIIAFKIEKETLDLLFDVCDLRKQDVDDFVNVAIRKELARLGYLSEEEKKALLGSSSG